ncbi:MAG: hypothetical protein ACRDN9_16060 [Streptosporangiaceae bacterium]
MRNVHVNGHGSGESRSVEVRGELIGRSSESLFLGEHGAAPPAGESGAAGIGVEPVVRGIGQLLVALSELLGSPAATATVHVGSLELSYNALHRARGSVRIRRLGGGLQRWSDRLPAEGLADLAVRQVPDVSAEGQEDGLWERGVAAGRIGDHGEAFALFEQEADQAAAEGAHGRAAIAYRSASARADRVGRHDQANRLLRLAGKHYLHVAEACLSPVQGIRQAYEAAAKCFLQAGNLKLAATSLSHAIALDETLGRG